MAAWLPNRHATVARPRTVGPSSMSTKTRRPPSMGPEVGANPSGRGCPTRSSVRRSPHVRRAPTAPIVAIIAPAPSTSRLLTLLLISRLPRRVATPPRAWRDVLSLHEEGIGREHRAITHRHAVVDEGPYPDRAARSE